MAIEFNKNSGITPQETDLSADIASDAEQDDARLGDTFADHDIVALASTVLQARSHFIDHGFPESRVSLSEAKRLRNYLLLFSNPADPAQSLLAGLWFTLGMDLSEEQIQSPLGQGLITLIADGGDETNERRAILQELIEPQAVSDAVLAEADSAPEALFALASRGTLFDGLDYKAFMAARIRLYQLGLGSEVQGEIVKAIKESGAKAYLQAYAFGDLAQNPDAIISDLIQLIKESGADADAQADAYASLAKNPNVNIPTLIRLIKESRAGAGQQALTYGFLAQSPNANIPDIIRIIKESRADASTKACAYGFLAQNPNTNIPDIIRLIKESRADFGQQARTYGSLAKYPNANIPTLIRLIKESGAHADTQAETFGDLALNPNANIPDLIRLIKESGASTRAQAFAYGSLAQNVNANIPDLIRLIIRLIKQSKPKAKDIKHYFSYFWQNSNTNIPDLIRLIKELGGDAQAQARVQAIYFEEAHADDFHDGSWQEAVSHILNKMDSIGLQSQDEGSRLGWVQAQDLAKPLQVLAGRLSLSAPETLASSDDFDFTLKTAFQLSDRVIKALSLNRFVLVTGDPASGKTEVGRFIADTLAWPTTIVNAHRYLSEEELMQKIGVELIDNKTRFVVTNGPLARALLEGHLFIFNELHNVKSGSLAFLMKILADVETSFFYYDPKLQQIVEKSIHPRFRLIATRNREGNKLNSALKSRAIEISARAYPSLELRALVRRRFPELSEKYGSQFIEQLVDLYQGLGRQIQARTIGAHQESYVLNLRHLLKLAEAFATLPTESINPQQLLQAGMDGLGVMLKPEDRNNFYDLLRNIQYGLVTISEQAVADYIFRQANLSFEEVFREFGINDEASSSGLPREGGDPGPVGAKNLLPLQAPPSRGRQLGVKAGQALLAKHGIEDIPTTARLVRSVISAIQAGKHPWLKGPAGTGKTQAILLATALLNIKLERDTLSPQTGPDRLKGEIKPIILEDGSIGFSNIPGALIRAIKQAQANPDQRHAVFLDEAGFTRPDVMEEFNSLLDRQGSIWAMNDQGQAEEYRLPKNLTIHWASNTYGHEGVQLQTDAFRSRTQEIFVDFEFTAAELAVILSRDRDFLKPKESAQPDFIAVPDSNQPELATDEVVAPPTQLPAKPGGYDEYAEWDRRIAAKPLPRLYSHLGPIAQKLNQDGMLEHFSPEQVSLMEAKLALVAKRLEGIAISMGRTHRMEIMFDSKTDTASMTVADPRRFRIGPRYLLQEDVESLENTALHEGGHADITRVGSGSFTSGGAEEALITVLEELRVNARVVDRVPGRRESFLRSRRHKYFDIFEALQNQNKALSELLPHELYLQAVMTKEYGDGSLPFAVPELVAKALEETWSAIQQAKQIRPVATEPAEKLVQQRMIDFEEEVRKTILPTFHQLYQESKKQLAELIESGQVQFGDEPNDGRPIDLDLLDPTLLQDLLNKRAQTIYQNLQAQGDVGDKINLQRQMNQNTAKLPTENPYQSGSLASYLHNQIEHRQQNEQSLLDKTFSRFLFPYAGLADQLFHQLRPLLKPNEDFDVDPGHRHGPKMNLLEALKLVQGASANLEVFFQYLEPTVKDYRFGFLLDASGSMQFAEREQVALGLSAVFADVWSRLDQQYSLDVFHSDFFPFKDFPDDIKSTEAKNKLFNQLLLNYWGLGGTALRTGIQGSLERIRTARKANPKSQALDVLFVLTDAEENEISGDDIPTLTKKALEEGILIVGMGSGPSMQLIKDVFPMAIVTEEPKNLIHQFVRFMQIFTRDDVSPGELAQFMGTLAKTTAPIATPMEAKVGEETMMVNEKRTLPATAKKLTNYYHPSGLLPAARRSPMLLKRSNSIPARGEGRALVPSRMIKQKRPGLMERPLAATHRPALHPVHKRMMVQNRRAFRLGR